MAFASTSVETLSQILLFCRKHSRPHNSQGLWMVSAKWASLIFSTNPSLLASITYESNMARSIKLKLSFDCQAEIIKTVYYRDFQFISEVASLFPNLKSAPFTSLKGQNWSCSVHTIKERTAAALAWHGGHWPCDWFRAATIQYRSEQRSFHSVSVSGRAHAQILGRVGKEIISQLI